MNTDAIQHGENILQIIELAGGFYLLALMFWIPLSIHRALKKMDKQIQLLEQISGRIGNLAVQQRPNH